QESDEERREKCAQIDSRVKDREARIASLVFFGIELAHHRADVRFQQSGTAGNQYETSVEGQLRIDRHGKVAAGDDDGADQHGASRAQYAIGEPTSWQRQIPNRGNIRSVD